MKQNTIKQKAGGGRNTVESMSRELHAEKQARKAIEEKLAKIQRLHDTVSHNLPDGLICVLDQKMRNVVMNGKDLHEIDPMSLGIIGEKSENLRLLLTDATLATLRKAFGGEIVSCEVKVNDKDFHITAVPLFDTKNAVPEILCEIGRASC